eukprot:1158015-Pelagomonas_calceolata.AAC.6
MCHEAVRHPVHFGTAGKDHVQQAVGELQQGEGAQLGESGGLGGFAESSRAIRQGGLGDHRDLWNITVGDTKAAGVRQPLDCKLCSRRFSPDGWKSKQSWPELEIEHEWTHEVCHTRPTRYHALKSMHLGCGQGAGSKRTTLLCNLILNGKLKGCASCMLVQDLVPRHSGTNKPPQEANQQEVQQKGGQGREYGGGMGHAWEGRGGGVKGVCAIEDCRLTQRPIMGFLSHHPKAHPYSGLATMHQQNPQCNQRAIKTLNLSAKKFVHTAQDI